MTEQRTPEEPTSDISRLSSELRTLSADVKRQFETVDARFAAVDARFDAVDARFDAVDARFDAVDRRFAAVDARFDAVDRRFVELEATLSKRIEDEGKATRRHFDVMVEKFSDSVKMVAEGSAHNAARVDDHETRIGRLEKARRR